MAALTETVALTQHALSLGVTTVVMLPPFYYKGVTDDGLFAAYAEVVERVADPRLRVVLYHIPQFSAVPITFPVIERLRARAIPAPSPASRTPRASLRTWRRWWSASPASPCWPAPPR